MASYGGGTIDGRLKEPKKQLMYSAEQCPHAFLNLHDTRATHHGHNRKIADTVKTDFESEQL